MTARAFSSSDLLLAGREYHGGRWSHRDRNAEQVYREEVVWRHTRDLTRGAKRFMGAWGALRGFSGAKFQRRLPPWLKRNGPLIDLLGGKGLQALSGTDFVQVLRLAGGLEELGLTATRYGKLLHYLIPKTVLLWDDAVVRVVYGLKSSRYDFIAYQGYGWRLLRRLMEKEGTTVLDDVCARHLETTGCPGTPTKLVDELAFHRELRQKARSGIGPEAFDVVPTQSPVDRRRNPNAASIAPPVEKGD